MSKIVFVIVGGFLGAVFGFSQVVIGAVIGFLLASLLDAQGRARSNESALAELQAELAALKARLDGLASTPAMPATAAVVQAAESAAETAPATLPEISAGELEAQAMTAPAVAELEAAPPWSPPAPQATAGERPAVAGLNPFAAAWAWFFAGNALLRVGVVVLFFGLAFLVKFAAEHTVVPIELRYLGIGVVALVMLGLGWRLRVARAAYAMALQGLGVAILYLVTFAAFRLHALLPGGLTLVLLVSTCGLSAALAVLQNARALAVIGICGGFLSPVLASTGGGSHVALFAYYALLNAGIVGIAWFKAWRPLNVLGFLFTFGIGSFWGSRNYRDDLFASCEPFLLLFFAFYLGISLLYARRRKDEISEVGAVSIAGERIDYVDGTLVFGTPLAAFGLQYLMLRDTAYGNALSALGLGLIYLPLARALYRRGGDEFRLLVESFLALGVIFASLAIPLALDAKWTSAAWAAEGAGIFWVGLRQQRPVARAFALLLQFGAGVSFLISTRTPGAETLLGLHALIDGAPLGALFVGAAGVLTALLLRREAGRAGEGQRDVEPLAMVWGLGFLNLIFPLLLDLQWSGLAWALAGAGVLALAQRHGHGVTLACGVLLQLVGGLAFAVATGGQQSSIPVANGLWLGAFLISAGGICSGYLRQRSAGETPSRLATLGFAWGLGWWWFAGEREVAAHGGELVLAARILFAAVSAHLLLAGGRLARWPAPVGAALLLLPLLLLFGARALVSLPQPAAAGGWLAWPLALATLAWVLRRQEGGAQARWLEFGHPLALCLLAALATWQTWWWFREAGAPGSAWPVLGWALSPLALLALLSAPALRQRWPLAQFPRAYRLGAAPLAIGLWAWVFFANAVSDGSAAPLPYLPVANPLDLASAGALLVLFVWLRRALAEAGVSAESAARGLAIGLGASAFYWLNGVLLRTLHHWADVPFVFAAMLRSTLVQAALSLFWALLALGLMLAATRRELRTLWLVGGGLMAMVVAKLFLVDLSRVGTVERIVSFIGVGLLLLVLGYFSPVPPRREGSK